MAVVVGADRMVKVGALFLEDSIPLLSGADLAGIDGEPASPFFDSGKRKRKGARGDARILF